MPTISYSEWMDTLAERDWQHELLEYERRAREARQRMLRASREFETVQANVSGRTMARRPEISRHLRANIQAAMENVAREYLPEHYTNLREPDWEV